MEFYAFIIDKRKNGCYNLIKDSMLRTVPSMRNTKKDIITSEKGVIYARYSSSGQREESIEGQLRECHEYAERYGINIVGEYCDHAMTGTNDKRPEFQRMIKDSAKGQFSVVLTWKNDRFARNRYDSAIYKTKLKQNGVRLLYAKESIPEGPEGIILESVMEGYAEYYSANLSQNVKRGNYESAMKLMTLGQCSFGLRKSTEHKWEPDPATAPIVRRIFEEYTAGRPAVDIARDLNEEGYRTLKGNTFDKNSLRRILENERYYGLYKYSDIRIENGIPPIVSREMFDKAQKLLKYHHEKPAAKKVDGGFLLTGRIFCGNCGEPMCGDGGTSHTGRVYNYYTCVNYRRKKCAKKRTSKEKIEDAVVQALADIANSDEIIDTIADKFMEWQSKNKDVSKLKSLEDKLKKIEDSIKNTLSVIDSGLITDSLKSHLVELESEKVDVEKSIAKAVLDDVEIKREQVVFFLRKFREADITDVGWRIFLVETFLQAVYVYDDKLLLHLNYSGDNNKISVDIAKKTVDSGELLGSDFASLGGAYGANMNPPEVYFKNGLLVAVIIAPDIKKSQV